MSAGTRARGVPLISATGSVISKPSAAYSAIERALNASWSRRIPSAPDERSITASISCRPIPLSCTPGSTVIGPTPRTLPRSSRKLEPTTSPSRSATTPQMPGWAMKAPTRPAAASSVGKSRGKRWWSWMPAKASKRIRATASASPGSMGRRRVAAASAGEASVLKGEAPGDCAIK